MILLFQSQIKSAFDVESIVINVPLYPALNELNIRQNQNFGVGVSIALMEMIKQQSHWAKLGCPKICQRNFPNFATADNLNQVVHFCLFAA